MPIIIPANSAASGGFNVDNSVRLDGTSAYLYKVNPGTSSTNNKRGTISCWVKKWGFPDNSIYLINAQNNDQERFIIQISNGDQIIGSYRNADGSNDVDISTSVARVYKDPAAWFNVVIAWNTSDGTGGNRMKLYVNGEEQGLAFSTDIAQNSIFPLNVPNYNSSYPITIGRNFQGGNADNYLPAYLAEFCFVDGQTLDGTSFGEFDEDSGIWKPIDVSGLTFGGLGWHLQFENSGALGTDSNDNGTWTTAGLAAIDQTQDTCTNNFATLNPLDGVIGLGNSTFSEGNLRFNTETASNVTWATSTIGMTSGKFYFEAFLQTAADHNYIGIADRPCPSLSTYFGAGAYDYGYKSSNGQKKNNGNESSYGNTYTTNDTVMCAVDLDNLKVYFGKNGTWQNSGNPESGSTGTGAAFTITTPSSTNNGQYFFCVADGTGSNNSRWISNFGNPATAISSGNADGNGYGNFEYAVPSGYLSLNTKNLSEANS